MVFFVKLLVPVNAINDKYLTYRMNFTKLNNVKDVSLVILDYKNYNLINKLIVSKDKPNQIIKRYVLW